MDLSELVSAKSLFRLCRIADYDHKHGFFLRWNLFVVQIMMYVCSYYGEDKCDVTLHFYHDDKWYLFLTGSTSDSNNCIKNLFCIEPDFRFSDFTTVEGRWETLSSYYETEIHEDYVSIRIDTTSFN